MPHSMRVHFTKYLLGYNDVSQQRFIEILKHLNWKSGRETITQINILISKIKDEYRKFQNTEHEYFPNLRAKYLSYIIQVYYYDPDHYFLLILTDFYILIRMFRSFGGKNKGSCIDNPYSDRIVLYGGYVHADNILKFISLYFNCIRYRAKIPNGSKLISFSRDTKVNKGGYRNFGDFFSWPS